MKLHRQQDTENEKRIAGIIGKAHQLNLIRTEDGCVVDFRAYDEDGTLCAVVEYKRRNLFWNDSRRKPVWVSDRKLIECLNYAIARNVPFYFVVEANDGLREAQIGLVEYRGLKKIMGGRFDRGIANDFELMAVIPEERWTTIK